ncbi:MAG: hypothetical protein K1X28_05030 [Parachlamydiales bacterium]|nr:hypothetical protein [Parachlamydiales bacterium]
MSLQSPRAGDYRVPKEPDLLEQARDLFDNGFVLAKIADLRNGLRIQAEDELHGIDDLETYAFVEQAVLNGDDREYKLIISKGNGAKLIDIFEGRISTVIAKLGNYLGFTKDRVIQIVKF